MYRYIGAGLSLLFLVSCTMPSSTSSSEPSATPGISQSGSSQTTSKLRIPSPTYGSGTHELLVYADFQCPACIAAAKSVMPIFENYAKNGYLHITYKQFPLTNIHKNAERDALAALCVASQGNGIYPAYKSALYAMEELKAGAKVTDGDRVDAAKGIPAVDVSTLTACLDNDTYLDQVHAEMKEGDARGVSGTPTIYLDDKKIDLGLFRDMTVLHTVMDKLLGVPVTATGTTLSGSTASGTQK